MPFHNLHRAYFTGEKFVPDPGSFDDEELFNYQSIIDQLARNHAEKPPEEQFATAEGDVTFEQLIEQFDMEHGQEAEPQPVPLPSALDGNSPSTEQPFGGFDTEPLHRLSEEEDDTKLMEPVPGMDGMEPGMDPSEPAIESEGLAEYIREQIQLEMGKTDAGELPSPDDLIPEEDEIVDDDYEGAFGEAEDILGPESGDIDLGVPVTEDEDSDFDLDTGTDDALEGSEMEEIFPDDEEEVEGGKGDYGLAKAILRSKERQKAAASIARKVVADTINIDFTFNDEGKPEVDIDDGKDLDDLGDEDLLGEEEGEGDDLFGEEEGEGEDLFGEGTEPKGKDDDLFDELGGGGEEGDLFGEEEGGGEDFLGI